MTLRLVFLGRLRDAAGEAERIVADAASLDNLLGMLEPGLAAALADPRIRIARNGEIVAGRDGLVLADGDEIAFLPPVSGG